MSEEQEAAVPDIDPAYGIPTAAVAMARSILVTTITRAGIRAGDPRSGLLALAKEIAGEQGTHVPSYLAIEAVATAIANTAPILAGIERSK